YVEASNDLSSATPQDLWLLPMTGDHKPFRFQETPYAESQARFSPDGRWIAYTSNESGVNEIYVQSFPAPTGSRSRVSQTGGSSVRWRDDGKELFYVSSDRYLMSVEVRAGASSLEFGVPGRLFRIDRTDYDVAPGGQRFLSPAPSGEDATSSLTV